MADKVEAELRCAGGTSANDKVASAVNCIERDNPATSISAISSGNGVRAEIAAQAMIDSAASSGVGAALKCRSASPLRISPATTRAMVGYSALSGSATR